MKRGTDANFLLLSPRFPLPLSPRPAYGRGHSAFAINPFISAGHERAASQRSHSLSNPLSRKLFFAAHFAKLVQSKGGNGPPDPAATALGAQVRFGVWVGPHNAKRSSDKLPTKEIAFTSLPRRSRNTVVAKKCQAAVSAPLKAAGAEEGTGGEGSSGKREGRNEAF